jgi:hypothetical protein
MIAGGRSLPPTEAGFRRASPSPFTKVTGAGPVDIAHFPGRLIVL